VQPQGGAGSVHVNPGGAESGHNRLDSSLRLVDIHKFQGDALLGSDEIRDRPARNQASLAERHHMVTHPLDLFEQERDRLQPLPETVHDFANIHAVRASNRFRVTFEANRYSVPAEYASQRLTLKAWPDRICIYHHDRLVARHPRSYDRHQDFEHPDHPRALLDQRRSARRQRLVKRFLTLAPCAERYYAELQQRRLNPTHHIRKIVALSEIHGEQDTARALADALHFGALGSEYIANLLESRARLSAEPGPLHLTRPGDALELDLPEPDLADYDRHLDTENTP